MYHNSSQRKYWIFKNEAELDQKRCSANEAFRNKVIESGKVGCTFVNYFQDFKVKKKTCFLFLIRRV